MIKGIGTDIVEIERISAALDRFGESFFNRIFSRAELAAFSDRTPMRVAGRWAAKEAAAKALGCGIGQNCAFTDVVISNDGSGVPRIALSGAAEKYFAARNGGALHLSISHERNNAVAMVVWEA